MINFKEKLTRDHNVPIKFPEFDLKPEKGPYYLFPQELDPSGGDHCHVCFAARVLGKDIKNHCPYWGAEGFSLENGIDYEAGGNTCECDECKYFGSIESTEDGLVFYMNEEIVKTYGNRREERDNNADR